MSETFAELDASVLRRAREESVASQKRALESVKHTAQTMRELLADPRWEHFTREVEGLKAEAEAIARRAERDLVEKILTPDQYMVAKCFYSRGIGGFDAYRSVLELIDKLIAKGEEAEKQLVAT